MAVSWSCLDIVRVEGGLLFFPYDMPEGDTTPWEVGLGWTVNPDKPAFRGREACCAAVDRSGWRKRGWRSTTTPPSGPAPGCSAMARRWAS